MTSLPSTCCFEVVDRLRDTLLSQVSPSLETIDQLLSIGLRSEDIDVVHLCAVSLKIAKLFDEALSVLVRARRHWPDSERFWYELIDVYRANEDFDAYDRHILDFFDKSKDKEAFAKNFVARALFSQVSGKPVSGEVAAKFYRYACRNRHHYVSEAIFYALEQAHMAAIIKTYLNGRELENAESVYDMIRAAIQNNRPFCLLRLGDGEGAILQNLDGADQSALHHNHLEFFARRWFGAVDRSIRDELLTVASELKQRISDADVIGMPPWHWIAQEAENHNVMTYINCLETVRSVWQTDQEEGFAKTDVGICKSMDAAGLLPQIVREAGRVSLITSRADIAGIIENELGVEIDKVHIVPPPASDPAVRDRELPRGEHLRRSFDETRQKLKETKQGDFYLVAAGFLGKIYSLDIRDRGGIAIDIGHVADSWVKFDSRPEMHPGR